MPKKLPAEILPDPTPEASPDSAPRDEVVALARGLAVLHALADAPTALSNRALADVTGIPKPTVSRLANTLVGAGYVEQDADSEKFRLGAAVLKLSGAYLRRFDMRTLCRPYLASLADRTEVSIHLGLKEGLDILMIDTHRPATAVTMTRTDIGTRMDIATSASGRAYFCSLPPPEQHALLATYRQEAPSRWSQVRTALARAQEEYAQWGYCTSFQEWHREINAIGLSLRGPRGELYAVSCGGPAYLFDPQALREKVAPEALATQRLIARACGQADA